MTRPRRASRYATAALVALACLMSLLSVTTTRAAFTDTADTSSSVTAGVGRPLTELRTGAGHTCAITDLHDIYCWGYNSSGQVGDGTTVNRPAATAVRVSGALAGKTMAHVYTGPYMTCALDTAGDAYCWGDNTKKQVANIAGNTQSSPVAVPKTGALAGKVLTQLAPGRDHVCALDTTATVYCWGSDTQGQLGDGTTTTGPNVTPIDASAVVGSFTTLTSGDYFTCGLTSADRIYCWGDNQRGQLGNGLTTNSPTPVQVTPQAATTADWTNGATFTVPTSLGNTVTVTWSTPTPAPDFGGNYTLGEVTMTKAVSGWTGAETSWNETSKSTVVVWCRRYTTGLLASTSGMNTSPYRGLTSSPLPQSITGNIPECAASYGAFDHLDITSDGAVVSSWYPARPAVLDGWHLTAIDAGASSVCALADNGKVACWGDNFAHEVNTSPAWSWTQATIPYPNSAALAGKSARALAVGYRTVCIIDTGDAVHCWGYQGEGQRGDGTINSTLESVPSTVTWPAGAAAPAKVDVDQHVCALTVDGLGQCWGSNAYGQHGLPADGARNTPRRMPTPW